MSVFQFMIFCKLSANLDSLYPFNDGVYSDQLHPSVYPYVMAWHITDRWIDGRVQYLKSRYSDQLLINTACVFYGSPHLKRIWSRSVHFLIFCEFFNFDFNISMRCNISKSCYFYQLLINTAYVSYGSTHLKKLWSCSAVLSTT